MGIFQSIERLTGLITTLLLLGLLLGYTYLISRTSAQFAIDARGNAVKERALAFTLGVRPSEIEISHLDVLPLPGEQCQEEREI